MKFPKILLALLFVSVQSAPASDAEGDPDSKPSPEEGRYLEGDMEWVPPEINTKQGLVDENYRWPKQTLVYRITDTFEEEELEMIQEALSQISQVTCIKFRVKGKRDKTYVSVRRPSKGCSSVVGMHEKGKAQRLSLAPNCFTSGWAIVAHEFIHALGMQHEQSRTDRDKNVIIKWDNIQGARQYNFKKYGRNDITSFGLPYDYDSIMHYGRKYFAIDRNKDTIVKTKKGPTIGQRDHLSEGDINKLNAMYCE